MDGNIVAKGIRVNNLKNIDVVIPRGKFVVITGLSGSGKSSLAFDTLFADGQRRYVESLSSYARQFMGRLHKPECDYIHGIPPAIAIEQKTTNRNQRSTVGTTTEIYDYLRMLFARAGKIISPISGEEVKSDTIEDIVNYVLQMEDGERFTIECPLVVPDKRSLHQQLEMDIKQGFSRITIDGEPHEIESVLHDMSDEQINGKEINLLIDRMAKHSDGDSLSRLRESIETAFDEGGQRCLIRKRGEQAVSFSIALERDGIQFEKPSDAMFSFNSPAGACPECEGFGSIVGIDESLVIPNSTLSVYDGAVQCWRGDKMSEWKRVFCEQQGAKGFPIFEPYYKLTQEQKDILWHGHRNDAFVANLDGGAPNPDTDAELPLGQHTSEQFGENTEDTEVSIDAFFRMVKRNQYKIQYRVMLSHYRGKTTCPVCHGRRLKKEAEYVKLNGYSITDLTYMPISRLNEIFKDIPDGDFPILVHEIRNRLQVLVDIGLGYLTLGRPANTLSGGESQRISIATSLGSSLVGSLYILDEPSIGLHSRDTQQLIGVLRRLQQLGNTVIVVEHDEEIMRAADYIIDLGPDAGINGGKIVYEGNIKDILEGKSQKTKSHTVRFLLGEDKIELPTSRRNSNRYIEVKGARANNLKGIDVRFPLNVITVVTGVSGSGKSTLVNNILYRGIKRHFDEACDRPGEYLSLEGDLNAIKNVTLVDQSSIGTSSRSNPITYIKAYDLIRRLMAEQPLSKQMDFTPATFSFNAEGGRCDNCNGDGKIKVSMQFMADIELECEECHGKRFKKDVLEVRFAGKNIHDILEMDVDETISFFKANKQESIARRIKPLQDVGLGYIKLGQPSSTLSGGENQRVKLAYYLASEKTQPTLFIFDEPTTGLHFHDISILLKAFQALIEHGHTIIIIEHNMEVIKCADHVIDLGPEGGDQGGAIVAKGTPEQIAQCPDSYTGKALREKL
ncbi:MAG: excinuclease ABC subunit UvrA [Prevotellaceae bacterium]|nr:excinuclease ABC subunit UvrA [Prevotellaceae bacterium]